MSIGFIDWTDKKLNLYVFEKNGNEYALADTLSVLIEGELDQSLLKSIVRTNIEKIYLSVPSRLLSLRALSFPFTDKAKIKDTISYELEGILLGSTNDYSVDYMITGSSESGTHVLSACMEKAKVKDIIDLFSSVGLEPVVITSLDLRSFRGNIEALFEGPAVGEESRAETAKEELVNPSINLRQDELSYKGDIDRIKKSLRLTGVLILILLLILGAYTTIKLISLKKENAMLTKEINAVYHNAFPRDTKIVDVVRQFKGNMNTLTEKKALLGGTPVADILLNISNLKNKDIILSEFNADDKNIIIKGAAQTFEKVDGLKNALSSSFADVKVMDSKTSLDNKIIFSIIMREKTL